MFHFWNGNININSEVMNHNKGDYLVVFLLLLILFLTQ
jgi:hypothetical protein